MCLKYAATVLYTLATALVQTVGSLDAVNARVAARGLQERLLLPFLVVDTVDCIEPLASSAMPPKRRAAGPGRIPHPQARQKPKNNDVSETAVAVQNDHEKSPERPTAEDGGKTATKTSLIELATFPGYTPSSSTPLPQSLDTLEQMRRVTRAQTKLAASREGYREYWRENFYSPASQTVFLDTFWWFFLKRYQPHRRIQCLLFSRVAENYVNFFMKTEIHTWKDKFLKAYPDAIAQCVYTAFIHAFPASWSSFDASFKSALVELVYLWQTGTRPMPELWKRWNFEYLDPPDSLKAISQEDKPTKPEKTFNLEALVEAAREEEAPSINDSRSRDEEETSESHSPPPPSPSQQSTSSRAELERALSRKLFQEHGDMSTADLKAAEKKTMDTARIQYLQLRLERRRKMATRKKLQCSSERDKKQDGMNSQRPSTHQMLPPSKTKQATPPAAKTKVSQKLPKRTDPTPPLLPPRMPQKATNSHTSQPAPPQHGERPPGSLKPCTAAEEARGGHHVLGVGNTKCKKMQKEKPLQLQCRLQTTAAERGRVGSTETKRPPKPFSTREEAGKEKASTNHAKQPSTSQSKAEGATAHPPTPPHSERTCRPVSAAEEYGLPNYVFEEGGKETTWKEKAITVREKTNQRPINILHKLHHQGTPLAVPEMESVCFNLFGRSPLVKHYLQKRRLNKVTGHSILTKRTEINQEIPSGAPTYEDVIQESLRESKDRNAYLASQRRQSKKQLQRILQERMKKRETYKRQLQHLLSTQKEVESLSNELVDYWEQRGVGRREGMASLKHTLSPDMQRNLTSCITKAFQRCSAHQQTSP